MMVKVDKYWCIITWTSDYREAIIDPQSLSFAVFKPIMEMKTN